MTMQFGRRHAGERALKCMITRILAELDPAVAEPEAFRPVVVRYGLRGKDRPEVPEAQGDHDDVRGREYGAVEASVLLGEGQLRAHPAHGFAVYQATEHIHHGEYEERFGRRCVEVEHRAGGELP